jgi:hypothetical protein
MIHMPSTRVRIVEDHPVFRRVAREDAVLDVCPGEESGFDVARALTGAGSCSRRVWSTRTWARSGGRPGSWWRGAGIGSGSAPRGPLKLLVAPFHDAMKVASVLEGPPMP